MNNGYIILFVQTKEYIKWLEKANHCYSHRQDLFIIQKIKFIFLFHFS